LITNQSHKFTKRGLTLPSTRLGGAVEGTKVNSNQQRLFNIQTGVDIHIIRIEGWQIGLGSVQHLNMKRGDNVEQQEDENN